MVKRRFTIQRLDPASFWRASFFYTWLAKSTNRIKIRDIQTSFDASSGNTARPISGIDPFGNGVKFDPVITKDRLSRWMQIINRASVLSAARNAPRAFCGIPRQLFEANDRAARGTGPRASRFHHQDFLLRQSRTIFFNFRNFRTLRILQLFLEKFYY